MCEWPEHEARVDISIAQGGGDAEGNIRVATPSGTMLFDIKIPWEEYAHAVLRSRGGVSAMVRLFAPELLGAEIERKTLQVFYDGPSAPQAAVQAAKDLVLKPFEIDGWRGEPSDLGNHHCRVKGAANTYEVNFRRHVLDRFPIDPVPSIPHAVLAAQRALADLEAIAPVNSSPTIKRAIAILRDGLGR